MMTFPFMSMMKTSDLRESSRALRRCSTHPLRTSPNERPRLGRLAIGTIGQGQGRGGSSHGPAFASAPGEHLGDATARREERRRPVRSGYRIRGTGVCSIQRAAAHHIIPCIYPAFLEPATTGRVRSSQHTLSPQSLNWHHKSSSSWSTKPIPTFTQHTHTRTRTSFGRPLK